LDAAFLEIAVLVIAIFYVSMAGVPDIPFSRRCCSPSWCWSLHSRPDRSPG
jgi:hypothetical protein